MSSSSTTTGAVNTDGRARARWRLLRAALLGQAVPTVEARHPAAAQDAQQQQQHPQQQQQQQQQQSCFGKRSLASSASGDGGSNASTEAEGVAADNNAALETVVYTHRLLPAEGFLLCKRAGQFQTVSRQLLTGFDATGLWCVWPAAEVLADWCLRHVDLFRGRTVLELGAGLGVAGLAVAAGTDSAAVVLTDGHPHAVALLAASVQRSRPLFGARSVSARLLRWDAFRSSSSGFTPSSSSSSDGTSNGVVTVSAAAALDDADSVTFGRFDVILAADCMFVEEFHDDLLDVVDALLDDRGMCLMAAPSRGGSFERCLRKAEQRQRPTDSARGTSGVNSDADSSSDEGGAGVGPRFVVETMDDDAASAAADAGVGTRDSSSSSSSSSSRADQGGEPVMLRRLTKKPASKPQQPRQRPVVSSDA